MIVELNKLPLGLYEKAIAFSLSWEEKLELTRRAGYDFLEINVDGSEQRLPRIYDKNTAARLRDATRQAGVPVRSMALTANRAYPLGSRDKAMREKGVEIIKRAVEFAAETGIRFFHIAAYDVTDGSGGDDTNANFLRSVEECLSFATAYCVTMAFETMDAPYMGSVQSVMRVVRMFDSPFLQAYADTGNLYALGVPDIAAEFAAGGRHIIGMHLKDATPGLSRDVPFGEGIVDFDHCLQSLKNIGYGGLFVAEMWSYDDAGFHPYLAQANHFLRGKLAAY